MRFVVYGAGAVGGLVGGRLHQSGHDVLLIARGRHYETIRDAGLTVRSAAGSDVLKVPVASRAAEAGLRADDFVLLGVKSQDTQGALRDLRLSAPAGLSVACLQNGVANEAAALRLFRDVYGVWVMCPASHLEPGEVRAESSPVEGIFDVGRYPSGSDNTAEALSAALSSGPFESVVRPDIMRWKYRKLILNLGNAAQAVFAWDDNAKALAGAARREGEAALAAAGTDVATEAEDRERRGDRLSIAPVGGVIRGGGSTWQSLARGTGSAEADYLNGEIVRLGRLHAVPTPVNEMLQDECRRAAAEGREPGTLQAPAPEEGN